MPATMPRLTIVAEDHGSVVLLRPQTRAARQWLRDNCDAESWQWFGDALAVEPRYALDILNHLRQEL